MRNPSPEHFEFRRNLDGELTLLYLLEEHEPTAIFSEGPYTVPRHHPCTIDITRDTKQTSRPPISLGLFMDGGRTGQVLYISPEQAQLLGQRLLDISREE